MPRRLHRGRWRGVRFARFVPGLLQTASEQCATVAAVHGWRLGAGVDTVGGVLPIERVAKRVAWTLFGVPAGEAAPCRYCRASVAGHSGVRSGGDVYCTEACADGAFYAAH